MLRLRYQLIIFACLLEFSREIENLSIRKNAWQPTNYVSGSYTSLASSAVDGNRNQTFASHSCAMQLPSRYPTWRVDLGKTMRIDCIDIYFRYESATLWNNVTKGRVAGFFLYISNTTSKEDGHLCFHRIHNETHPITPNVTIQCIQHGRYVIYYNERRPDVKYPSFYSTLLYNEICELEVYGCINPGFYGNDCTRMCPPNCKNMYCDIGIGTCFSCTDGYQGEYCHQQCLNLSYGSQCAFPCGKCVDGEQCNHVNGICPGSCATGWQGAKCDKVCPSGTYGNNCTKNCSVNCFNKTNNWCNNESAKCTSGCRPGWQEDRCDKVCDNFYFGAQCEMQCGKCHDQKTCDNVNGLCPNGCSAGFQGEDCMTECHETFYGENCKLNCSSRCANRTCHSQTGVCRELIKGEQVRTDTGPLIGGVVGGLLVLIVVLSVVTILFVRRRTVLRKENSNEYADIDLKTQNDKHIYSTTESRYQNLPFITKQ